MSREDEEREEGDSGQPDDFIDRSDWPVLRITFPEKLSLEDLDRHFASLEREGDKRQNFVAIVDLDALRTQSRELRQHASAHLKRLDDKDTSRYLKGVAHVSDNFLSRASLTIVLSLSPPPYPNRAFRRLADAEAWVRSLLANQS